MLALALQVRSCLSWRDIQHLIVFSAVKHDVDFLDYSRNGAGFHHSHKYGFGLLDSWRLVNVAKTWKPVPWMTSWSSPVIHVDKYIPRKTNQLIETYTVKSKELVELSTLEHVTLTVNIEHAYRGSILVSLVSPAGTESKLATERQQDRSSEGFVDWTFSTVRCWGEKPSGTWQIIVVNSGLDDDSQGFLKNWRLTLYGSSMTPQGVEKRRRMAEQSFSGHYLNSNLTAPCLQHFNPDERTFFTDRLLTIVLLVSGFCLVLAVYYILDVICGYAERQDTSKTPARDQKELPSLDPEVISLHSPATSTSSLNASFEIPTQLKSADTTRLSHILELGRSCRDKLTSQSQSSDIHSVLTELAEKSCPGNEDRTEATEHEFERRLQYAMEQSLLLQGRQLRDIENLQEQLGSNKRDQTPHALTGKKVNSAKIHKPVKGILKKKPSRSVKTSR